MVRWRLIVQLILAAVGTAAFILVVAKTLPAQPWWPGWAVVGAWWVTWWPAVVVAVVVIAVVVVRTWPARRNAATGSPQWIHRADGTGWIRAAAAVTSETTTARSRSREIGWSNLTSVVTAFTALAALVFTGQSLNATRDQINVTEQGQITDRYTTAVDQISTPGADHLETRLGGIYALESVAIDSPRDQPTIIEVLSAFVRSNAPSLPTGGGNQTCAPVALDVQAAMTVLGRRNPAHDANAHIDLSHSCLTHANLTHANLTDADLTGTNLGGADLIDTNLTRASLANANLDSAELGDATLTDASLANATLTDANVADADLADANLDNADLDSADLDSANLTETGFVNANLTSANLGSATLTFAYLYGANLTGADLGFVNLTDASLADANLTGANLTSANLNPTVLTDANLTDANLTNANLAGTSFAGTNLTNANFAGATGLAGH